MIGTRKHISRLFLSLCWLLTLPLAFRAQCPPNIGFESGTLANWECFSGTVANDGTISLSSTAPSTSVFSTHLIIPHTNASLDSFGLFPVSCPNGSNYSIRLGNKSTGAEADRVSYTFTVPLNMSNFSIMYNYAVVLENPDHDPVQQPKFTAAVFDVTANHYISCASFEFIANPDLPGFHLSLKGESVYYKPWSSATINLKGYEGKTIRLDFTVNDCSQGGHFGYAYLDIPENCTSPVKGNIYCTGSTNLTLRAPFGFQAYEWYNQDFSTQIGNTNPLTLNPHPPDGTVIALVLIPTPGLGCRDTIYTTVTGANALLDLHVRDSLRACYFPGADITAPSVTAGSTPGLSYSYYLDPVGADYVPRPDKINHTGTYYVAASNAAGCFDIKPVFVRVLDTPALQVKDTVKSCVPQPADLTQPAVTAGSDPALVYSYWNDAALTNPLTVPNAVSTVGTYYIQALNANGCTTVKPVIVSMAQLTVHDQDACSEVNLTAPAVTLGSSSGFSYTYWTDAGATGSLSNPSAVTHSGTYFIKGAQASGCSSIKPVQVTVYPGPDFTVANPPPVEFPATVDLTHAMVTASGNQFSYWKNAAATQPLPHPEAVTESGTYYIKGTSANGCSLVRPVEVTITPPPPSDVRAPNSFSPNGDGIHDTWSLKLIGIVRVENVFIYNRWGQLVFQSKSVDFTWDGRDARGQVLPMGTYYWIVDGMDVYYKRRMRNSGSVTLVR